ncbi:MAG: phage tail tape measure protein [Acidobacteriota bacterium]
MSESRLGVALDTGPAERSAKSFRDLMAGLGTVLARVDKKVDRIERSTRRQASTQRRTNRTTRKATSETRRHDGALRRLNRTLSTTIKRGVVLAATFVGISSAATLATQPVRAFSGWESQMASVLAVTGATQVGFEALQDQTRLLGETTVFAASQAAEGATFLGRAGFKTQEILSALPGVLDLAAAGVLDLGRAADISSNILSAFNLEASRSDEVADALAAGAASANTSVEQLGDAMKFVGPVASALNMSVQDTAAGIGVLSNAGIQGEMAGTGLRRVLAGLASPTRKAEQALAAMGLAVEDVNPATHSLIEIVQTLATAGIDVEKAFTLFGQRGGPAILALTSQVGSLEELTDTLRDSGGAASEMAEIMMDTLTGSGKELASVWESVQIEVGQGMAPALREATDTLKVFLKEGQDGAVAFGTAVAQALTKVAEALLLLARHGETALSIMVGLGVAWSAWKLVPVVQSLWALVGATTALGVAQNVTIASTLALEAALTRLKAAWAATSGLAVTVVAGLGILAAILAKVAMSSGDAEESQRGYLDSLRETRPAVVNAAENARDLLDTLDQEIAKRKELRDLLPTVEERLVSLEGVLDRMGDAIKGDASDEVFSGLADEARALGVALNDSLGRQRGFERVKNEVEALRLELRKTERDLKQTDRGVSESRAQLVTDSAKGLAAFDEVYTRLLARSQDLKLEAKEAGNALEDAVSNFRGTTRGDFALTGFSSGLREVQDEAKQTALELEDVRVKVRELQDAFGQQLGQLLSGGDLDGAERILKILPDRQVDLVVNYDGESAEEFLDFQARITKAYLEVAGATKKAAGEKDELADRLSDLLTKLQAELSDVQALTDAYANGSEAVVEATIQIEIDAAVRQQGKDFNPAQLDQLRKAITELVRAERELAGTQILDELNQQEEALRQVIAAYSDGPEAVSAAREQLDLVAETFALTSQAAADQADDIEAALQRIQALRREEQFNESKAAITAETAELHQLIAAYEAGGGVIESTLRQLDMEAEKRDLLEGLIGKERAELERLIEAKHEAQRVADVGAAEADLERQLEQLQRVAEVAHLGQKAIEEAELQNEIQDLFDSLGVVSSSPATNALEQLIRKIHETSKAIDDAQYRTQRLAAGFSSLGNAIANAFAGVNEQLAGVVSGLAGVADAWGALDAASTLEGMEGTLARLTAGLQMGSAVGGMMQGLGIFQGQGGTGRYGGQLSGDYGDVGAAAGGAIGAAIGSVIPVVGTALGGVVGSVLGGVIGGAINQGADTGLATLQQVGDDVAVQISQNEGGLGDVLGQLGNAVIDSIQRIEDLLGTEIKIGEGGIGIKLRDDTFVAFANGLRQEFAEMEDAVNWIIVQALKSASFGKLSPEVKAVLEGGTFETVEELERQLALALSIEEMGVPEAQRGLRRLRLDFQRTGEEASRLGIPLRNLMSELGRSFAVTRRELLGIEEDVGAQVNREAEAWNAERLELVREYEDKLTALLDSLARAEALESGGANIDEILAGVNETLVEAGAFAGAELAEISAHLAGVGLAAGASAGVIREQITAIQTMLAQLPAAITDSEIAEAIRRRGSGGRRPGGSGYEQRKRRREELRAELAMMESDLGDSARRLVEQVRGIAETREEILRLGALGEEFANRFSLEQAREVVEAFLAPFREISQAAGEQQVETDYRRLRERYAEEIEAALAAAEELQGSLPELIQSLAAGGMEALAVAAQGAGEDVSGIVSGLLGPILEAEAAELRQLGDSIIDSFSLPLESARDQVADLAARLTILAQLAEDGAIDVDRLGEAIAELATQAESELLSIAAEIEERLGNTTEAAELRNQYERLVFEVRVAELAFLLEQYTALGLISEATAARLEEVLQNVRDTDLDELFSQPAAAAPPSSGTSAATSGQDARQRLEQALDAIDAAVRSWLDLPIGDATREARRMTAQLEELKTQAREAGIPLSLFWERVGEGWEVARQNFFDTRLEPYERLGRSRLELEAEDITSTFDDLRESFAELGAGAGELARLDLAEAAAWDDFWSRATEGLRGFLDELQGSDPTLTGEDRFFETQARYRDLLARAQAGDLGAVEELEGAARAYLEASRGYLGAGVGGLGVRREIESGLEGVIGSSALGGGGDDSAITTAVKDGNDTLLQIRDLLAGGDYERFRPAGGDVADVAEMERVAAAAFARVAARTAASEVTVPAALRRAPVRPADTVPAPEPGDSRQSAPAPPPPRLRTPVPRAQPDPPPSGSNDVSASSSDEPLLRLERQIEAQRAETRQASDRAAFLETRMVELMERLLGVQEEARDLKARALRDQKGPKR